MSEPKYRTVDEILAPLNAPSAATTTPKQEPPKTAPDSKYRTVDQILAPLKEVDDIKPKRNIADELIPAAGGAAVGVGKASFDVLSDRFGRGNPNAGEFPRGLQSAREAASQAQTGVTTALNNYRAQQLPYYTATDIAYANLGATTAAAEEAAQALARAQAAARPFGTPVERTPVVNWATGKNTSQGMTPLLTPLQASQQPSMEAAYALNRTLQPVAGMAAGEHFILPEGLAGEQRTAVNALQAAQQAHTDAQAAQAAARAHWLGLTGNAPAEFARAQTAYQGATNAVAQTAEELARLEAARPGPLAQAGRAIARTFGRFLPIAGGALAGHDIVKGVAETQKKNPNYTEAAMDFLGGTGGALMLSGNPYAVGTGALMSAVPVGRSLVNQYAKAITPMLEKDPRNARFLVP